MYFYISGIVREYVNYTLHHVAVFNTYTHLHTEVHALI